MHTASSTDLDIARLVHHTISTMKFAVHPETGKPWVRFGESKVFISSLWARIVSSSPGIASRLGLHSSKDFGRWLLTGMRMADAVGHPLVVLARADVVGAMHYPTVQQSEIEDRGATFHFVLDRAAAPEAYGIHPAQAVVGVISFADADMSSANLTGANMSIEKKRASASWRPSAADDTVPMRRMRRPGATPLLDAAILAGSIYLDNRSGEYVGIVGDGEVSIAASAREAELYLATNPTPDTW